MNIIGLISCARYAYPPSSLSLCGPDSKEKQRDLKFYATQQKQDKGTPEILSQFSTLYPYLSFIAYENNIRDPFDRRVVEAYWLGNKLLDSISISKFSTYLKDTLRLKKKIENKYLDLLLGKLLKGGLPHHAFHVLNVYKRTGNIDSLHILDTMEACLINWGKVEKILPESIVVETKPLRLENDKVTFGQSIKKSIMLQGEKDIFMTKLQVGDWISYHWGYFCQKLTLVQFQNLIYYTKLSLTLANNN